VGRQADAPTSVAEVEDGSAVYPLKSLTVASRCLWPALAVPFGDNEMYLGEGCKELEGPKLLDQRIDVTIFYTTKPVQL